MLKKLIRIQAADASIVDDIIYTSTLAISQMGKSSMRDEPVKSVSPLMATSFKY